jgi:hypothetical protein
MVFTVSYLLMVFNYFFHNTYSPQIDPFNFTNPFKICNDPCNSCVEAIRPLYTATCKWRSSLEVLSENKPSVVSIDHVLWHFNSF